MPGSVLSSNPSCSSNRTSDFFASSRAPSMRIPIRLGKALSGGRENVAIQTATPATSAVMSITMTVPRASLRNGEIRSSVVVAVAMRGAPTVLSGGASRVEPTAAAAAAASGLTARVWAGGAGSSAGLQDNDFPNRSASRTCLRSPRNSAMERYRSSGRFRSAFITTPSRACGTAGFRVFGDGTGSFSCFDVTASVVSAGNGVAPQSIS